MQFILLILVLKQMIRFKFQYYLKYVIHFTVIHNLYVY